MARNKNRKQGGRQSRRDGGTPTARPGAGGAGSAVTEAGSRTQLTEPDGTTGGARKQRRFGHN